MNKSAGLIVVILVFVICFLSICCGVSIFVLSSSSTNTESETLEEKREVEEGEENNSEESVTPTKRPGSESGSGGGNGAGNGTGNGTGPDSNTSDDTDKKEFLSELNSLISLAPIYPVYVYMDSSDQIIFVYEDDSELTSNLFSDYSANQICYVYSDSQFEYGYLVGIKLSNGEWYSMGNIENECTDADIIFVQ